MPFTVSIFNSKKGAAKQVTIEVEANQNCNLGFNRIERLTLAMNMQGADIEVLKVAGEVQMDSDNTTLFWHIPNLYEEGSAVLSFTSQRVDFDEMFPFEVKFEETYSLIDMQVNGVTSSANGEAMSQKVLHSLQSENYWISGE